MKIKTKFDWEKLHRFQRKPGWCGPAVVQMIMLAAGIRKTQFSIAQAIYKPWWGTDQQMLIAYLSRYFSKLSYKAYAGVKDLKRQLKRGNLIIVDWWDDLDDSTPDGHYTLVIGYDTKRKKILMADPSNARLGLWEIDKEDFKRRWYDSLDIQGKKWVSGWMLWVDPSSKDGKI